MAITFVAEAHNTTNYTSSTVVTKPTGTVDNDVLIAVVGGVMSGTPSGWTALMNVATGTGGSLDHVYVYYKVAASEGANYTFSNSAAQLGAVSIVAYRGVDNTTPIDLTNKSITVIAGSTDFSPASITAAAGNWAVTFGVGYDNTSATPRTYTETGSPTVTNERADFGIGGTGENTSLMMAEYASLSSGAFAPTATRSASAVHGAKGALLLNVNNPNVSANAESPTATSAAYDAVVQTGVAAQAAVATATGAALDIAVGVQAAISTSATAYDASVQIKASGVEVATATASAGQVGAHYGAPPGRTVTIGAESRSYSPPAESRVYTISILGDD